MTLAEQEPGSPNMSQELSRSAHKRELKPILICLQHSYRSVSPATSQGSITSKTSYNTLTRKGPPPPPPSRNKKPAPPPPPMKRAEISSTSINRYQLALDGANFLHSRINHFLSFDSVQCIALYRRIQIQKLSATLSVISPFITMPGGWHLANSLL